MFLFLKCIFVLQKKPSINQLKMHLTFFSFAFINKKIALNKESFARTCAPKSDAFGNYACCLSPVTCHLSLTSTATYRPPAKSPILHSMLVRRDQKEQNDQKCLKSTRKQGFRDGIKRQTDT